MGLSHIISCHVLIINDVYIGQPINLSIVFIEFTKVDFIKIESHPLKFVNFFISREG